MHALLQYTQAFGFFKGTFLFLKVLLGATKNLKVPGIKAPVFLRPGTIDSYTFLEVLVGREYDFELPSQDVRIIIDGGANIGLTSVFFANKYPEASIIAIEPEESNFVALKQNIQPYDQITPLKKGIWGSEGYIEVKDKGYGLRGFMVEEVATPTPGAISTVSIPGLMRTYHFDHIDILKLDIEGSEKQVFEKGYEAWLPKVRCLVVELHDRMVEGTSLAVFRAISQYNFSCEIKGDNLIFINKDFLL